ncbi:MAG: riboflavin synthase, partial [Pseudomonadota bacterium]
NGVSLTVNAVNGTVFEVNLVPHTLQETNLDRLAAGTEVNVEVDLVARYLERLMLGDAAAKPMASGLTLTVLAQQGFVKGDAR